MHLREVLFLAFDYTHRTLKCWVSAAYSHCFQVRGLVSLQRTMTNDESNVFPCFERALSGVLEGVVVKYFFWGQAPRLLLSFRFTLTVTTGSSLSPSHFQHIGGRVTCVLHGISTPWCQSNEDFHCWCTCHCILYLLPLQRCYFSFCYHILEEFLALFCPFHGLVP